MTTTNPMQSARLIYTPRHWGICETMRTLNVRMADETFEALERLRVQVMADEKRVLDWEEFLRIIVTRLSK